MKLVSGRCSVIQLPSSSQEIKAISKKIDKLTNSKYTKITDLIKIENYNKTIKDAMYEKFH